MKIDFSNKVALVVGSSRGIGKGVLETFSKLGASVHAISRTNGIDITDKNSVDKFFESITNIDFLINVAGINFCKKIEDIELDEWDAVLDTNLRSFYYLIKKSIPLMKAGSKIVNVSSIAGRNKSIVSGVHYTSSKAGIIGLTRQLANELGPRGINVNCTCPSQTLTPMLSQSMTELELNQLTEKIPLRRLATVSDQVGPIVFLCSELSNYMTGSIIDINGGQL
ncbi:SDR family oxidoreductase [Bacteroidota bacterium]|nr:SDR family oxidoreductase [Bacteroidota bacterium]